MAEPMLLELLAYSTGLVVMQRLESRHSLLKRFLAWRHKQMPATLSAALRRRENKDLESDHFRACLPDLLSCIGELDPGDWKCKTEFLERFSSSSACALHDPLTARRAEKGAFQERLAIAAGHRESADISELPLLREHIRTVLERGRVYALLGCQIPGSWSVFRVLNTAPHQNTYLQKASCLSLDAAWLPSTELLLFVSCSVYSVYVYICSRICDPFVVSFFLPEWQRAP